MDKQTAARSLGSIPLLVVGCGPVGVAALWYAALEGIPAVGIDAGQAPLSNLRSYMDGLVVISSASHYQIPGLPLDCRDTGELTREEILHYYARVINYGQLQIEHRTRCTDLELAEDHVTVRVDADGEPAFFEAEQVIVTSWYEPRRLLPASTRRIGAVEVIHGLRDPAAVAGRRCVVIGGGASAYEQASAIMLCGQPVSMVMRGSDELFGNPYFDELLVSTESTVVGSAMGIQIDETGVAYRTAEGQADHICCDVVVVCVGQQLNETIAGVLERARVLSPAVLEELRSTPTLDTLVRHGLESELEPAIERAVASRPDLWDALFHGVGGVRLVGGGLHVGGAHAGVATSIYSAQLAIDAILGREPHLRHTPPLARALMDRPASSTWSSARFDVVAPLRPVALRSWSRTSRLLKLESAEGFVSGTAYSPQKYLLGDARSSETANDLIEIADGSQTVLDIATEYGLDYDALAHELQVLWKSNGLSWLPPTSGLADVLEGSDLESS